MLRALAHVDVLKWLAEWLSHLTYNLALGNEMHMRDVCQR